MSEKKAATPTTLSKPTHFLRQIIERDVEAGTYAQRRWGGGAGDASFHRAGVPDTAKIRTRFPPEPNGYLHIGHVKSICLNFGLAQDFGGICHLRYDDTNPEKEEQEYVDAIADGVRWLGFDWVATGPKGEESHKFFASDYFDFMYCAAEALVMAGNAYVDEQTPDQMRANRGDFNRPGKDSPFRNRTPAENLARFREMRDGKLADGAAVLRAKIDMASPNINLRDPAIYRIRRATHHNTGDTWCIYPMYTFAHPIEDALENITHSFCTLEFEDQRPFYDWLLDHLADLGLLAKPTPKQYEFGRLNVTHVLTSKRKLKQLVDEGRVSGWDDPRMPTVAGLRARGYTPAALRAFADGTGASKTNAWVDYSVLETCARDDLDPTAARAMAVLDPLKLVITNWPGEPSNENTTEHHAPVHPQSPERGQRAMRFGQEIWIERSDFQAVPDKGYHRLYPPHTDASGTEIAGSQVRLKYGYVVRCTGFKANASGHVTEVHAEYFPESKSGTPTSGQFKAKGVITWVSAADAGEPVIVNVYEHLFTPEQPGTSEADFLTELNPNSLQTHTAFIEPSLRTATAGERFQFERHGYFIKRADGGFNRITGLKDSWAK